MKALNFYALPYFSNQISYVLSPKFINFFMTHRRRRVLILQVFRMLKIYLINLFTAWEVEAPKVGAPSSHVMSLGPLFIGDAPNGFLLEYFTKIKEKGCENIRKILEKF